MDAAGDFFKNTYPGWIAIIIFTAMSLTCAIWPGTTQYEAPSGANYDSGNTAWMLVSCALVLLMTPGLAFFYGGLVQEKNIITCLTQSYAAIMVITVLWVWFVYSLCFGEDINGSGVLGSPATYFMFKDIGAALADDESGIPKTIDAMFQLKFAIITPALISGAFAERINFKAYLLFITLFCIFIYAPACHMEWGDNGLLGTKWGVLDFAGGTVVHMSSGYAALAGAYYLGPSEAKKNKESVAPASVPFMMLGTAMLFFGWFGFNAGSAYGASADACQVFVNTHVAAATGMMGWTFMEYFRQNKLSASGMCIGCIAGLVGITPACGYVTTGAALWIGLITAMCSNVSAHFIKGIDSLEDTLDVFSCHGVGGSVGLLLTGCFATLDVNSGGDNGWFYGNGELFGYCIATVVMMGPIFFLFALILLKITDLIIPLRVTSEVEKTGLDISHHGETLPGVEMKQTKDTNFSVVPVNDASENI